MSDFPATNKAGNLENCTIEQNKQHREVVKCQIFKRQ